MTGNKLVSSYDDGVIIVTYYSDDKRTVIDRVEIQYPDDPDKKTKRKYKTRARCMPGAQQKHNG